MKVDLRKDFKEIYSYIQDRVKTFDPAKNKGPGKANSPITEITVGFQCDQAGWIALVFDTRPKAEPDGEWNKYINKQNVFKRPHWQKAFEALEEESVEFTLPDGEKKTILPFADDDEDENDDEEEVEDGDDEDSDDDSEDDEDGDEEEDEYITVFGELLKGVLLKARKDGVFDSLPKAKKCHMGVEEMDGNYGWPNYEDRGKTDLV
jgi:hypothetical protein